MVLYISGIIVALGIFMFVIGSIKNSEGTMMLGVILVVSAAVFGFLMVGTAFSVTEGKENYFPNLIARNGHMIIVAFNKDYVVSTDVSDFNRADDQMALEVTTHFNSYGFEIANQKECKIVVLDPTLPKIVMGK